jgi:hypothetical protein
MPPTEDNAPLSVPAHIRVRQEDYLKPLIQALWERSDLPAIRAAPLFQFAHAMLRDLITRGQPELLAVWYGQRILEVSGFDAVGLSQGTDPAAYRIAAPAMTAGDRQLYHALVSCILDGAGLYDRQYPEDNRHYRLLVAHLLLWPKEIHDASQIVPPFPWPWFVQEERGRRLSIRPEQAITAREQEELVNRLNGILRNPSGKRPRAAYGSLRQTARSDAPDAAKPAMSPEYETVAKVACDLLDADPYLTLGRVVESRGFRHAQVKLWDKVRINSVSRLSELLTKYRQLSGRSKTPRRRDPPLR